MPTKKESPVNSNINTNNNTNNVNVNVKVEHPRAPRKTKIPSKPKSNWFVKAIVVGIIGLVLSLIGYYIKNNGSTINRPAVIKNASL